MGVHQSRNARIDAFAVIIGAMKAGTTSAFRYLKQHPQIAACSIKEPGFFNDDRCFAKGLDWYHGLWDWDPSVHARALEASTEYTHPAWSGKVAGRLAALDADVRLIYVVRHPVDRIESQYNHGYSAGWFPRGLSIDEVVDSRPNFIERSRYAARLDAYREHFPAESILIVNSADLASSPAMEMARVVGFLGLRQHEFDDLGKVHNPGGGRIIEGPVIARIRTHRRLFDGIQRIVPRGAQDIARKALGRRLNEPFRMKAETRARVMDLLSDDLERLRAVYGVDTSRWTAGSLRADQETAP